MAHVPLLRAITKRVIQRWQKSLDTPTLPGHNLHMGTNAATLGHIESIKAIIAPMLGMKAWGVSLGYSTFITLEFGEPRDMHGYTHGAWHLWIYGADWRLEERSRILAGSSDDREKQATAVKRMDGLVLQDVEVHQPMLDTTFFFEDDVVLRLFASYSDDLDHWLLFVPDGNVLTVGPGSSWSYLPASE